MPKNMKLLLIENVDSLGIVGDVVSVRTGFARNFLLPRALATTPSEELVASLAAKRAEAERLVAQQRSQREETTEKLRGVAMELMRSCNDQGILYGAITQQDVATELTGRGYVVKPRDVRLPGSIKRVDSYEIHIKLDSDLDALIKLVVKADRELPKDAGHGHDEKAEKGEKGDRPEREDRRGGREEREDRREKAMRKRADAIEHAIQSDKARVVGWAKKEEAAAAEAAAGEPVKSEPKGEGKGEKKSKKK